MPTFAFFCGSLIVALLLGTFVGNLARGLPLGPNGSFIGTFWSLLNPYALLVGVNTVSLFMMHGAIYLVMKTEGDFHDRIRGWVNNCIIFFIICAVTTTMATLLYFPRLTAPFREYPVLFCVPILLMLAIANVPRQISRRKDFLAFLSSCAGMTLLLAVLSIGLFPNLVYASNDPSRSLTVFNASSSPHTLHVMLIIALIGMPIVLAYTAAIYWIFRDKVRLDSHSY